MADNRPWSVKGIEPETRRAAKIAARREGLTLGAWLSRTIRSQAARDLKRGGPEMEEARQTHQDQPHQNQADPSNPGPANLPAPSLESLLDTVRRLRERLDTVEERATESAAPVAHRLDEIAGQLRGLRNRSAESVTLVEQALISLNERLRRLERGGPTGDAVPPDDHDARTGRISRLFNRDD
ncbi:MAG: hypothetical protein U1E97_07495 [Alphaproteobacteria bacterium]